MSDERDVLATALLLDLLQERQAGGQVTVLRDLHRLLDMPQPVALRAAQRLVKEGLAAIAPDNSDAFASRISVTKPLEGKSNNFPLSMRIVRS